MARKSNHLVTVAFRFPARELPLLVGAAVQVDEPLSVFLRRLVFTSLHASLENKRTLKKHDPIQKPRRRKGAGK